MNQARRRRDVGAIWKYAGCECTLIDSQVVSEQALEHGAQIGGRFEVAILVELGLLQPGPVGHDAPAAERSSGKEGHGPGAVIGAIGAVDARGAAELGHDGNHGLAPVVPHVGLDRSQGAIERAQKVGELTGSRALVDVRIPADKAERAAARAVRLCQEARSSSGGLGEVGAYSIDAGNRKWNAVDHRSVRYGGGSKRGQAHTGLKRGRQLWIGV